MSAARPIRALYYGSFDPFTNGHLYVMKKASELFDEVVICVMTHPNKTRLIDVNKTIELIRSVVSACGYNAGVEAASSALAYKEAHKFLCNYLVRGIRNNGLDYAYEENLAELNKVSGNIDTIFIRADEHRHVSSSVVKVMLSEGDKISQLVPPQVEEYLVRSHKPNVIIGVTGKSGVGKTTFVNTMMNSSVTAIHVDDICHDVLNEPDIQCYLTGRLGTDVINKGVVDRKYIGNLIFENRELYADVIELVWPRIKSRIDSKLHSNSSVIIDWVLLPHTHYWNMCTKKILITADENRRRKHVMIRDNISESYLNKRDAAGIIYDESEFDEIWENCYSRNSFELLKMS